MSDEWVGRTRNEIAIMRHMHWSYADLCAAPDALVLEIARMLAERGQDDGAYA